MHIIHVSVECYPVAKVGGLADVVGALPKFQSIAGDESWVVMPAYQVPWIEKHNFEIVHKGHANIGPSWFRYTIGREKNNTLGFPLYVIDIPGRFDRTGVYVDPSSGYGYWDEFERYLSFQVAFLQWLNSFKNRPDIIHCHDHHTALIPFMMTSCPEFSGIAKIPTVLTIHNGEYHGCYDFGKRHLLPYFDASRTGYLEWSDRLNSLAAGIRTCWTLTTVSPSYMEELKISSGGLEHLIRSEEGKAVGIINGIDTEVWDPKTDPLIEANYSEKTVEVGKRENKEVLCNSFNLDPIRPTFAFIGRLVKEKGADLLPALISNYLEQGHQVNFVILGTGDPDLHFKFNEMSRQYVGYFDSSLQYNEKLAHQIYAGSDFLLMPSRVEPCGLNQMYSLRYGTIPIVRSTGGLKDTVIDFGDLGGYGIRFNEFSLKDLWHSLLRAQALFGDKKQFINLQKRAISLDFSWNKSAKEYIQLYKKLIL
jgi:starch synthase